LVQARSRTATLLITILLAGCIPQPAQETPTPTALPTSARPRFELATYMYALQTRSKIRIGVLDKAIPFAVHDSSGLRTGFEIDLGRELAKAIFGPQQDPNSVIEWISVDRTTAVSALTSVQADVTIARLAAPEGGSGPDVPVDLSDAYFVTGERILVKSSNDEIEDLPDLDTKTVCVQRDTAVGEHVIDASAFARTLALDTYASCLGALQEGQVDAIGADEAILWNLVKLDPNTKLVGRYVTTERYSIGVKKNAAGDRQGFLPFLNAWLAGAIRDGTWARLYAQDIKPYSGETKTSPS
jgi:polar amino acid transport system substrate-binding protein